MADIIVGGVIEKDNKFLLVQESKKKCYKKWNIPAGHLDPNESIFEGAKREILEETNCKVELTGILEISNKVLEDKAWVSIIFSTKLLEDNVKADGIEILDAKWFSYEDIINMKEELRNYDFITNAITRYVKGQISDINMVNIIK